MHLNDIIVSAATPTGGAIAIVRIEGPEALVVCDKLFRADRGIQPSQAKGYKLMHGNICDGARRIDDVLVTVFRAPHSYTGGDMVEISCHGSAYIVGEIIRLAIEAGARSATAGEFTMRAFIGGKMDLSQAEAVADVIAADSKVALTMADTQMRGNYSAALAALRGELLTLASLLELELDFGEEEVEFADRTQLVSTVRDLASHVRMLIKSFALGNVIKNGVPVAIAGATNTGKSTLLNALLGEERAIVSSIHGTTRDTIEETLNIDGITFRFIDTAGIRNTTETIEIIGIERTYTKIQQASLVLMVFDAERPEYFEEGLRTLSTRIDPIHQQVIILLNKVDALDGISSASSVAGNSSASSVAGNPAEATSDTSAAMVDGTLATYLERIRLAAEQAGIQPLRILPIAAKQKKGIAELCDLLSYSQTSLRHTTDATLVTNLRHYEALQEASQALDRVQEGLELSIPTDLVAQDIREAIHYIGTITGSITTDEVLGNIFGKFCIGK